MGMFSRGGHTFLDKKLGRPPVERDFHGNVTRRCAVDTRTTVGEWFSLAVLVVGTALAGLLLP